MCKFSLIIPVYNTEKYLKKCLSSVTSQTFKDYEIILINDGSTDGSNLIIEDFKKQYPNLIKVYTTKNCGVSSSRNLGIEKATGDFFLFIDSDDYISLNLLEIINNNITDNLDILSYNLELVDENYNTMQKLLKPEFNTLDGQVAIVKFIKNSTLFDTPVRICI